MKNKRGVKIIIIIIILHMEVFMVNLAIFARIILGLISFDFGLNGFFQFLPMPAMPAMAGTSG